MRGQPSPVKPGAHIARLLQSAGQPAKHLPQACPTPITPTAAIRHDHSQPVFKRRITVAGQPRAYMDQFCWIAFATLLGLPATSVPIGRTKEGLPFNVQVIGAPGTDLTTIGFARLLEEANLAGFQTPKGF
ncbi:amidase family protein [Marinobacter sp. LV10R510-11A]|uniref:amidase family protein n=1 Tax=Marinobacter sp. LV10R510-11A TaxID=1415568 RepID=UPI0029DE5BF5|nr:amidase family protein [Marinobacter sp. LV10R510-11A]